MKRVISKLSLAAAVALACAASAHAADGTITITGKVTDITCNVSVSGGGKDYTVTLPTVSVNSLSQPGDTAGATPFNIALSGCTNATTAKASTWFEPGANVDSTTGRLTNNGDAQNVQVELLNSAMSPIDAGSADQHDVPQDISSGGSTVLNYFARYHATGAATAGAVTTAVQYTIVYQ